MCLMTARDQRPSLRFVEGINVELTYGCQLDCPHCLQADQRARGETAWADPEPIRRALIEALDLGLIRTGINFTGGEILRAGSPLPALLETTRALGVPVRLNTNGWWGRARRFLVGERRFDSAEVLIGWLQAMGIAAGFSGNPVTACFSGANFERTVTQVLPTQSEPARRLRHPCGLAAAQARRIAEGARRSASLVGDHRVLRGSSAEARAGG